MSVVAAGVPTAAGRVEASEAGRLPFAPGRGGEVAVRLEAVSRIHGRGAGALLAVDGVDL